MEKPDLTNRCYKSKDDHRHSTAFFIGSGETEQEREERLKNLRESRGTWVWDEETGCVVREDDYYSKKKDVDAPQISRWDPEWSLMATGKRMSKGELKQYCKEKGKVWENG